MTDSVRVGCLACLLFLTPTAYSQESFLEDFEDGLNEHSWAIGTGAAVVEATGGNPGAYLREGPFDLWSVQIRHGVVGSPPPFLGDYMTGQIDRLSFDLITLEPVDVEDRQLFLTLRFGLGTIDASDDIFAIFEGPPAPEFGAGWFSVAFDFPFLGDSLPLGWQWHPMAPTAPIAWETLMQDVGGITLFYGDPGQVWATQTWTIGVDNIRITSLLDAEDFRRGDCNLDDSFDISDAITSLATLFLSGSAPLCPDACDSNDDGVLDISDPVTILATLFTSPVPLPEPSLACGADPTVDLLGCDAAFGCP